MSEPRSEILTVTEAAGVAKVSRPTVYRWMQMQGFPVIHIGRCTRIPAKAFFDWMVSQSGGVR